MQSIIRIVFLVLTTATAWGAVAYDNKISSGAFSGATSVTTGTFTIGAGVNRAAIACLHFYASNNPSGITVSVGGVSGSAITGADTGTATTSRTVCFCVTNPPSGSRTASASWTNAATGDFGVITATGVDQTTPCTNGAQAVNAGAGGVATVSVTITSASGDLTVSAGQTENALAATPTNRTLRWGVDSGVWAGDTGPGTGTTVHTWTDTILNQHMTAAGANFKAAGGGGATSTVRRGEIF